MMTRISVALGVCLLAQTGCQSPFFPSSLRPDRQHAARDDQASSTHRLASHESERSAAGSRGFLSEEPRETPDSAFRRGRAADAAGQADQARVYYERALELDPGHADSHHALAILADKLGDYRAAERHYLRALEQKPRDPNLLSDIGYSYFLQARRADSERYLRQALQVDTVHPKARGNLELLADQDKALETYRALVGEREAHWRIAALFPEQQQSSPQIAARPFATGQNFFNARPEAQRPDPSWPIDQSGAAGFQEQQAPRATVAEAPPTRRHSPPEYEAPRQTVQPSWEQWPPVDMSQAAHRASQQASPRYDESTPFGEQGGFDDGWPPPGGTIAAAPRRDELEPNRQFPATRQFPDPRESFDRLTQHRTAPNSSEQFDRRLGPQQQAIAGPPTAAQPPGWNSYSPEEGYGAWIDSPAATSRATAPQMANRTAQSWPGYDPAAEDWERRTSGRPAAPPHDAVQTGSHLAGAPPSAMRDAQFDAGEASWPAATASRTDTGRLEAARREAQRIGMSSDTLFSGMPEVRNQPAANREFDSRQPAWQSEAMHASGVVITPRSAAQDTRSNQPSRTAWVSPDDRGPSGIQLQSHAAAGAGQPEAWPAGGFPQDQWDEWPSAQSAAQPSSRTAVEWSDYNTSPEAPSRYDRGTTNWPSWNEPAPPQYGSQPRQ